MNGIYTQLIRDLAHYNPEKVPDKELVFDNFLLHVFYNRERRKTPPDEERLQLIVRKTAEVRDEMERRGFKLSSGTLLDTLADSLRAVKNKRLGKFADVNSFRETAWGREVSLDEIVKYYKKPIVLSNGFVSIVGGLAVRGKTEGDIDILIKWPSDTPPTILKPVEFRLGRALPKELSERLSVMLDDYHGPFTSYFTLYDLVLMPHEQLVEMQAHLSDSIKLLEYFTPLKGVKGYHKNEEFSYQGVQERFSVKDYPLLVEKKYDGARLQIHKKGDVIKVYTDGGKEVSARFPSLHKLLKDFPEEVILDTETEKWVDGKHLGREEVSSYINSKGEPDDSHITFNVFDILWFRDAKWRKHDINATIGDLHLQNLAVRRKYLEILPFKQSTAGVPKPGLNLVVSIVVKKPEELRGAIKKMASMPASEGAMIKSSNSLYPLTGLTKYWVKYKNMADIHAIVLEGKETKTKGVYNYVIGLLPGTHHGGEKRTLGGREYVVIGKTYSWKGYIKPGTIVTVTFHTLFYYEDEDRVHIYEPRIYETRPDQKVPDTVDDMIEIARKANLLQVKNAKLGAPGFGVFKEAVDGKPHEFVYQHHYRGKSRHGDFRVKIGSVLQGFTFFEEVTGCIKDEVESLKEAKQWDQKCSKWRWEVGNEKIEGVQKAPEPLPWLHVSGAVPPGEVGATKNEWGVFSIVNKGKAYITAVKPYFLEMFLDSDKFKGRLVITRVKPKNRSDIILNIWIPKDQMPYALSARAEKKGFKAGPNNVPPWIAKKLPDKWWENVKEARKLYKSKMARKERFALHYRYFRGHKVVREGPSKEYWDVYVGKTRFKCKENPVNNETTALRDVSDKIEREGYIPVGDPDNPYKEIEGHDSSIMQGTALVLEDSPLVFKAEINGKYILFAARDNTHTDVWTVSIKEGEV